MAFDRCKICNMDVKRGLLPAHITEHHGVEDEAPKEQSGSADLPQDDPEPEDKGQAEAEEEKPEMTDDEKMEAVKDAADLEEPEEQE